MAEHFPLKLVGSRMLAPSVRHLEFARDDGQALDFIAGQFIQVHFNTPDGSPTKRSYSLATQHDHAFGVNDTVEIAVSFVPGGAASALFTALDGTTKTTAKLDALTDYFRTSPEGDRLWTIALLSGRRPRRTVTSTELRLWAADAAGVAVAICKAFACGLTTDPPSGLGCSHCGLSVATTKTIARVTVTVWEKINQVLRMMG